MSNLGVVAIGRNEGDRLRRCLDALAVVGATIVYVDSGSTDDSTEGAAETEASALVSLHHLSVPRAARLPPGAGAPSAATGSPTPDAVG